MPELYEALGFGMLTGEQQDWLRARGLAPSADEGVYLDEATFWQFLMDTQPSELPTYFEAGTRRRLDTPAP